MITLQDGGSGLREVFVRPDRMYRDETISLIEPGYTPLGNRFDRQPIPSEKKFSLPRDKSIGTNISEVVRVMPPQNIGQDTYLDDEVGDTIRYIKEKFGSDPLLKAYQGALDTLEESNRRWKEYYEEEARLQSIFEGED
jgi:hypothetical protein